MAARPEPAGLDWLLDDLLSRLPGAEQAVVLSGDGMLIGRSGSMPREDAEHLSAVASGLQSLARGASRHLDGGAVRQTIVEMDRMILIVTTAGVGACLAVVAEAEADLGLLAYEMNMMVKRVGAYVSPQMRFAGALQDLDPGAGGET